MSSRSLTSIEICAGAGGQALGLEQAGFEHRLLVEYWEPACQILEANEPGWRVERKDVRGVDFTEFSADDIDLVAGGVPCTPASKAGKQLGASDSRNLWPEALRMVEEVRPRAAMFENVRGLMDDKFAGWRQETDRPAGRAWLPRRHLEVDLCGRLRRPAAAPAFGACRLPRYRRPGALRMAGAADPSRRARITVGEALKDLVSANGWQGAQRWATEVATAIGRHWSVARRSTEARTWVRPGRARSGSASVSTASDLRTTASPRDPTGLRTSRSSSTFAWLRESKASPTPGRSTRSCARPTRTRRWATRSRRRWRERWAWPSGTRSSPAGRDRNERTAKEDAA